MAILYHLEILVPQASIGVKIVADRMHMETLAVRLLTNSIICAELVRIVLTTMNINDDL